MDAEISLLVCDKPEARAVGRANYHHIPCFAFQRKHMSQKKHLKNIKQARRV